ncbi:unnamed protein product [Caenorhabditis auriculariae]|uniref:Aquaporin n=1 Tax=Caenorhabditis auriculariae TaxID=2777116 RepID=A0A8S1GSY8_9PELO|nr:unnamed protein product [Caenorhabditis auriculariae]
MASLVPLFSAIYFYTVVLVGAELSRRLLDLTLSKKSALYRFLIELIGTTQVLSCVIEHGIIKEYYGLTAFFFTLLIVGFLFGVLNRKASCAPLVPIEKYIYGDRSLGHVISILVAEVLGAMLAISLTNKLWALSAPYSDPHLTFMSETACQVTHYRNVPIVLAFETIGAFALRFLLSQLDENIIKYMGPLFVASIFSFATSLIGDSAMDPLVATTLWYGCAGITSQYFLLLYYICPTVGWLLGAYLDRKIKSPSQKTKLKAKLKKTN